MKYFQDYAKIKTQNFVYSYQISDDGALYHNLDRSYHLSHFWLVKGLFHSVTAGESRGLVSKASNIKQLKRIDNFWCWIKALFDSIVHTVDYQKKIVDIDLYIMS